MKKGWHWQPLRCEKDIYDIYAEKYNTIFIHSSRPKRYLYSEKTIKIKYYLEEMQQRVCSKMLVLLPWILDIA